MTSRSTTGSISGGVLDAERYTIRSGLAVVINNSEFLGRLRLPDRPGSLENEAEPLEERFRDLGFKTILLTDVTKENMENKFSEIKSNLAKKIEQIDCLIIIMLTHGNADSVYAQDQAVQVDSIMSCFSAENCAELILKPKIFIFQASRQLSPNSGAGIGYEKVVQEEVRVSEGVEVVRIPNEADFLAVYSTALGEKSFQQTESASPFLQHLIDELKNMGVDDDFYSVLTRVNCQVMQFEPSHDATKDIRQMSCFVSHLTKDLYLNMTHD
ncbi:caspase-6-like [Mytilus galloprovincialis]|uniref:caspase-6-like n=1 Tax=Mytilus galloprovincialis TaxID=29158 RepID=UPI003F7CA5CB